MGALAGGAGATTRGTSRPASRCRRPSSRPIDAAELWGEGFGTLEYLAATLLDQAWHRISPDDRDRRPGRRSSGRRWQDAGVALPTWSRRATARTYFQHIFAGGYSAGLLLLHLVGGARRRHRGVVQGERRAAPGERRHLPPPAAVGRRSVDPLAAFRAVRGRDADPGPLLRRRGLAGRDRTGRAARTRGDGWWLRELADTAARSRHWPPASQPGELEHQVEVVGGVAVADQAVGLAVAAHRCSGARPASPCPTSPPARSAPWAPGTRSPGRPAGRRRAATTGRTGSGCGSARRCWPAPAPRSARRRSRCSPPAGSGSRGPVRGRTARCRRPRR